MRLRRRLRQSELAAQAHTGQSAISRIEKDDYDGWSYKTLLAIASVLKARLRIRLEPLEDVIEEYRRSEEGFETVVGDVQPGNDTGAASLMDGADTEDASIEAVGETTAPQNPQWMTH